MVFEGPDRDLNPGQGISARDSAGLKGVQPLPTVPYVTATPPGPSDVQKVDKIKGI